MCGPIGNSSERELTATTTFLAWKKARNENHPAPANPVPDDLLTSNDLAVFNIQLSLFVLETRKANGEFYPTEGTSSATMRSSSSHEDINPGCPNFLDKKDGNFKALQGIMDTHFHYTSGVRG